MKRGIMITCVVVAGIGAIATTVAAAWPNEAPPNVHHDTPAADVGEQVTLNAEGPAVTDAVCPYGAAAAPQSGCCGGPSDDAGEDAGGCGGPGDDAGEGAGEGAGGCEGDH